MSVHEPVMGAQVADALELKDGGWFADCTYGRGGYVREWLRRAKVRVYAIDRDPDAIRNAEQLSAETGGAVPPVPGVFGDIASLLAELSASPLDGVAMDLGVSSPQLDEAERGFSFMRDGPLDMRMGREGPTAADIINYWTAERLADLFFHYGDERRSRRIARAIVEERADSPFASTLQLADSVARAAPAPGARIHPATRVFQALRIAVNDELGELRRGLTGAEKVLGPGGRLAVVSFHSLEDRIVKQFMLKRSGSEPRGSRHQPEASAERDPSFRLVKRGAIKPDNDEIRRNPRARSARLRVAERLSAPAWPIDEAGMEFAA